MPTERSVPSETAPPRRYRSERSQDSSVCSPNAGARRCGRAAASPTCNNEATRGRVRAAGEGTLPHGPNARFLG